MDSEGEASAIVDGIDAMDTRSCGFTFERLADWVVAELYGLRASKGCRVADEVREGNRLCKAEACDALALCNS